MYFWSNKKPAAPADARNVTFQSDGGKPEYRSAYVGKATAALAGVLKLDAALSVVKWLCGDGTWKPAVTTTVVALTDAATIAVNAALGNQFRVTVAASRMLGNPTGAADGQLMRFEFKQGGAGGWAITFDTKIKKPLNLPTLTWSTQPGAVDMVQLYYNATEDLFTITGHLKNIYGVA